MKSLNIPQQRQHELLLLLQKRFEKNMHRHPGINWADVQQKLTHNLDNLWVVNQMEETGGEPDVIGYNSVANTFTFCDCAPESPKARRSVCYDQEALLSRKEHKPKHSAVAMAEEMGITLLNESQYRELQQLDKFDTKTSSWIDTPADIRALGGALFGDYRFGHVFIYHNGAESYYAARGFRGLVQV